MILNLQQAASELAEKIAALPAGYFARPIG